MKKIELNSTFFNQYKLTSLKNYFEVIILLQNILYNTNYFNENELMELNSICKDKLIDVEPTSLTQFFPPYIAKVLYYDVRNNSSLTVLNFLEKLNIKLIENNEDYLIY